MELGYGCRGGRHSGIAIESFHGYEVNFENSNNLLFFLLGRQDRQVPNGDGSRF